MPIDFSKPSITGNYATDILQPIQQAITALAQMLDPAVAGTLTATPTGAYRINGAAFERYNGTAWAAHVLNIGGNAATATAATTATHLAGGAAGAMPYQTAAGATAQLAAGTSGHVLRANGAAAPSWVATSTLAVGSATTATNLAGGAAGRIPYNTGAGATGFVAAGTTGQVLVSGGTGAPTWTSAPAVTTQAVTNSSTSAASTAFVRQIGVARSLAVGSIAAAATLTTAQLGSLQRVTGSAAYAITLPLASTYPAGTGIEFAMAQALGIGVTLSRQGADTLTQGASTGLTATGKLYRGDVVTAISDGSGGWTVVVGGGDSGTYTPTFNATSGSISAFIASTPFQYARCGSTVSFSGLFFIDTSAGGACTFTMTPPFASANFTAPGNLVATGLAGGAALVASAQTASTLAAASFSAPSAGTHSVFVNAQYRLL